MRKKDLRAAALHIRLMAVGRGEIRELVLRSLARAAYERSAVGAPIRLLGRLRPLGRALGAAERAFDCVEAAPLDDPVLAAVREDRSLLRRVHRVITAFLRAASRAALSPCACGSPPDRTPRFAVRR